MWGTGTARSFPRFERTQTTTYPHSTYCNRTVPSMRESHGLDWTGLFAPIGPPILVLNTRYCMTRGSTHGFLILPRYSFTIRSTVLQSTSGILQDSTSTVLWRIMYSTTLYTSLYTWSEWCRWVWGQCYPSGSQVAGLNFATDPRDGQVRRHDTPPRTCSIVCMARVWILLLVGDRKDCTTVQYAVRPYWLPLMRVGVGWWGFDAVRRNKLACTCMVRFVVGALERLDR